MSTFHPPFSGRFKNSSSQDALLKCALCEKEYLPDEKNRKHQLYCSLSCRSLAKKNRDKLHKQTYRKKKKYKQAKRDQNRRYREKKRWAEYMKLYREYHREEVKEQNRKAAKKYYERNSRKIAFKRSEIRWKKRLKAEIEALKKASS